VLEPHEVYPLLVNNHLPSLTDQEQHLIAARVTGWSAARIAARTYRSERAVRDHLDSILDKVCGPTGVDRDAAVLGWWFAVHCGCSRRCAAGALDLIQAGAVFGAAVAAETT
jgi:hypothetical protein